MKPNPFPALCRAVLLTACLPSLLHAEQTPASGPVRTHIPHETVGTPPQPPPPKPLWRVAPSDVIEEKEHLQDGRRVLVRQITPIDLPPPPTPAKPAEIDETLLRERARAFAERHPKHRLVVIGATIYKSSSGAARSHVRVSNFHDAGGEPVSFLSSGDFSLLSGIGSYVSSDGSHRALLMVWSLVHPDRESAGGEIPIQNHDIPGLPTDKAAWQLTRGEPDDDLRTAIQSLHDILNDSETAGKLREAYAKREEAARLRAEESKIPHPPKDIILNHWRVDQARNPKQ